MIRKENKTREAQNRILTENVNSCWKRTKKRKYFPNTGRGGKSLRKLQMSVLPSSPSWLGWIKENRKGRLYWIFRLTSPMLMLMRCSQNKISTYTQWTRLSLLFHCCYIFSLFQQTVRSLYLERIIVAISPAISSVLMAGTTVCPSVTAAVYTPLTFKKAPVIFRQLSSSKYFENTHSLSGNWNCWIVILIYS